jgi:RNA polymerase sigma-70 factor (ECF subfamily)
MDEHHARAAPDDSQRATTPSLLAGLRANDPAAWDRLVRVYAPLVWHWCRASGLQEQDQADVLQEVFQAVARRLPQFRHEPGGTFRGWLRTVTRSKICDLFRRRRREPVGAGGSDAQRWLGQVEAPVLPEEVADPVEDRLLLRAVLDRLRGEFAERTWQAFWRTVVECRAAVDVAAELGMSPGAVRVAKCRVLGRLREELGEEGG